MEITKHKTNEDTYSVYMHRNKINNKVYIGITCQVPASYRWGHNGNGYKTQPLFYNAISKYTWKNFEHIILYDNLSQIQAEEKEKELILKYDSTNRAKGYNIQYGGQTKRVNEVTKKILSKNHKGLMAGEKHPMYGKHHDKDTRKKISEVQYKALYQYKRTGEFIKRFKSTLEAEKELNIPNSNISSVCLRKMKTSHDFVFRYENDELVKYGEPLLKDEVIWVNSNDCTKTINVYYKDSNILFGSFDKVADAISATKSSKSSVYRCLSGKVENINGFIFKYA